MKLLLVGYYGHGLSGDDAILEAMLRDIPQALPGCGITVTSADPAATRRRHGVEAVPLYLPHPLFEAIQTCDMVVLGGGGVFTEYTPHVPVVPGVSVGFTEFCCDAPHLAALCGKRSFIFAAGVEPIRSDVAARAVRAAFDAVDGATVRDSGSLAELARLGVDTTRVSVTCDPAAALTPPPRIDPVSLGLAAGRPVLALALRHWDLEPERLSDEPQPWEDEAADAVRRFVDRLNAQVLLVSSHDDPTGWIFANDSVFLERFAARLGDRRVVAPRLEPTPANVAAALAAADVALVSRHHGVVLSVVAQTPPVALGYSRKVMSAMRDVGLAEFALPLEEVRAGRLVDSLETAFSNRKELRGRLAEINLRRKEDHARTVTALAAVAVAPKREPLPSERVAARWLAGALSAQTRVPPEWTLLLSEAVNFGPNKHAQQLMVAALAARHPADAPLAYYDAVLTELVNGSSAETAEMWHRAVELGFAPAWAHYFWGENLRTRGDVEGAVRHLSLALQLDPEHAGARSALEAVRGLRASGQLT